MFVSATGAVHRAVTSPLSLKAAVIFRAVELTQVAAKLVTASFFVLTPGKTVVVSVAHLIELDAGAVVASELLVFDARVGVAGALGFVVAKLAVAVLVADQVTLDANRCIAVESSDVPWTGVST